MYAAIRRDIRATRTADDLVRAARALSAAFGQIPGFISWVLLESGDDALVSVSVCEDAAGLDHAGRLLTEWLDGQRVTPADRQPEIITGEVILQKGL